MAPLLHLKDITVAFGGSRLLDGAELSVAAGDRLCLVGRNGSGKSTLLKIAAGLMEADGGTRFAQPGATIRYLPQEPDLSGYATTRDYVEAGLEPARRSQPRLLPAGQSGPERARKIPPRCRAARRAARRWPGRWRRGPIFCCWTSPPTIWTCRPSNGWKANSNPASGALVLISHDRRFLENLSRAIVWLDRGQTHRLEQRLRRLRGLARRDAGKGRESSATSWSAASPPRKTGCAMACQRAAQAQPGPAGAAARPAHRAARADPQALGTVKMEAAEGAGSRHQGDRRQGRGFPYGDREIVRDFSLRIHRGDRIGIVGPNGAGKTTLLKLLTGELAPRSGNVKLGQGLVMAKLDQNRASCIPNNRWPMR